MAIKKDTYLLFDFFYIFSFIYLQILASSLNGSGGKGNNALGTEVWGSTTGCTLGVHAGTLTGHGIAYIERMEFDRCIRVWRSIHGTN